MLDILPRPPTPYNMVAVWTQDGEAAATATAASESAKLGTDKQEHSTCILWSGGGSLSVFLSPPGLQRSSWKVNITSENAAELGVGKEENQTASLPCVLAPALRGTSWSSGGSTASAVLPSLLQDSGGQRRSCITTTSGSALDPRLEHTHYRDCLGLLLTWLGHTL